MVNAPSLAAVMSLALSACTIWQGVQGRRFNDTGTGTIIFEEAWTIPELIFQILCVVMMTYTVAQVDWLTSV